MAEKPVVAIYLGFPSPNDLGHIARVLKEEDFDVKHLGTVDDLLSGIAQGLPVKKGGRQRISYVVADFTRVDEKGRSYDELAVARVANACSSSGIGFTACASTARMVGNIEVLARENHKGIVEKVENCIGIGIFRYLPA